MQKSWLILIRVGFLGLLIFEFLNLFKILNFSLDFTWLGLIGTAITVWVIFEIINYYYKPLPWYILGIIFLGLVLDASSDIFHIYSRFNSWDRFIHFIYGILGAIIIHQLFEKLTPNWLKRFFTITTVVFLGFLYEYWEMLVDKFYFQYQKALGDGVDTVDDLFFNALGAVLFITLNYLAKLSCEYKRTKSQS